MSTHAKDMLVYMHSNQIHPLQERIHLTTEGGKSSCPPWRGAELQHPNTAVARNNSFDNSRGKRGKGQKRK